MLIIGRRIATETVRSVAGDAGYQILAADDEASAMETLRAEQPSVVLLDRELEGGDGLELLKAIRAEDATCEAILVAKSREMATAIEVLRAGALDYLRQPVDPDDLRVALDRARDKRKRTSAVEPPAILVMDDHDPTRVRLGRVLAKEGYRVRTAADGEEGMRALVEHHIDLVLTDVRMPRKDGIAVLHEVRRRGWDMEVILITGYGDVDIVVQALRDGAVDFLRKPIDIDDMLAAVRRALATQTLRRSLAFRQADMQLMHEFVVRLTRNLELVVDSPEALMEEAVSFMGGVVDALPVGFAVFGSDRGLLFANRHIRERCSERLSRLDFEWLSALGIHRSNETAVLESFERTMVARPGTVETAVFSKFSFLVMMPVKVRTPGATERVVAVLMRGDRGALSTVPPFA